MTKATDFPLTSFHWGTYRAEARNGDLVALHPFEEDPDPSPIGQGYLGALKGPDRITAPMVRKGWLEGGAGTKGSLRGKDAFVEVSWDEAEQLIADELTRVINAHGNQSIFAGSYGWASAGRFHHAQSHLKRFLNLLGGFTRSVNSYSLASGEVILPHVLGGAELIYDATSWQSIIESCDLMVAFGGVPIKNSMIGQGGLGAHRTRPALLEARAAGVEFVNISPLKSDLSDALSAEWIAPRPSTDAALMIGLAHVLLSEGLSDRAFLDRYTVGFDRFANYLTGESDGIVKNTDWAAEICGIRSEEIQTLARRMASGRTMISVAWALTRQDHGEQNFWLGTVLAAMLGQIGLPGGGVGFGYGAVNTVGLERPSPRFQAVPQGRNKVKTFIPVARIAEMLENPGGEFDYNGKKHQFPDTKLIWWAGGNPFHHHQDLNRLRRAWARPDTVIVNDWCWNSAAQHADIVLPCTTPLERADITLSPRDPYLVVMDKVVEPSGQARDDYDIFRGIARHLGIDRKYSEERDADQWITWLYEQSRKSATRAQIDLPPLDELRKTGWFKMPVPNEPHIMLSKFRQDPEASPLRTPSGKIEIFSEKIASFGYDDCPGHPTWMEPVEWLGRAEQGQLHLISNQPKNKLHSQLDQGPVAQGDRIGGREPAMLHPDDAAAHGIRDGDCIRVFNGRGACLCGAVVSDSIVPGVIQISTGAWFRPDPDTDVCLSGNPNVLCKDKGTSRLSQGPTAHSCLVRVALQDERL
ncbi:molybdopterin guanine dinucleotide-containing S/N-oxide reductase [Phaeobacter sp. NW0010-22]|uniref:molybdopterin guanine dinucleotide-containing S/N-oxide reductase n=1 Tax=Phaeobacter sp. NW0010-22 TaxID=3135907 RepID=UPI0031051193